MKNPLIIICSEHGEFLQTPHTHLMGGRREFKGCGCQECAKKVKHGLGEYNIKTAERNKDKWINRSAVVYVIKCWNDDEVFYKIGMTIGSLKRRFRSNFPYRWEKVKIINTNLYDAVYLERKLLNNNSKYNYRPKLYFAGYTECFSHFEIIT